MTIRRKSKKSPEKPSEHDTWANHLRTECARAIVEYLRAGVNIKRPISSLTKRELEGIAEAVSARRIVLLSQRIFKDGVDMPVERKLLLADDPGPIPDDYLGLLM